MRQSLIAVLFTIYAAVTSATSVQARENRITVTGSSTIAPLASEIGKRYEEQHPGVRIDVQMGGSSRGINDVRRGLADIGMVSRKLKPAERDLMEFLIAMDGIGIILHKSNRVSKLSDAQLIDIYTGKILSWQQVGGADLPITVVNKAAGRSTLDLFLKHFSLKSSEIKAHAVIGDNQQGIKTVSGNRGAIGYVSIGAAEFEAARGAAIKLLPMAGQPANRDAVATGRYPLSRHLNLVVKNLPDGSTMDFIKFAQSPDVADLVEAQFYVVP